MVWEELVRSVLGKMQGLERAEGAAALAVSLDLTDAEGGNGELAAGEGSRCHRCSGPPRVTRCLTAPAQAFGRELRPRREGGKGLKSSRDKRQEE
jgi:hypothetical protein